jgi:predicted phosphodiesterase
MRYGLISDIHGNEAALDAVLAELARMRVDRVICLGDAVNPLPGSAAVFARLVALGIPVLRGNHEDYVVQCNEQPHAGIALLPNFLPVVWLASRLSPTLIDQLKALPMTLSLQDPHAGHCLLVHASPSRNRFGYRYGIDDAMAAELSATDAKMIVCGHWHDPETRTWNGMELVTIGSVGVPLRGRVEAEFAVVSVVDGRWTAEHLTVPYDSSFTLAAFRSSGLLDEGGPVAWFFYEEIRTGEKRLSTFFKWAAASGRAYDTLDSLTLAARDFLLENGSWVSIEPLAANWMRTRGG